MPRSPVMGIKLKLFMAFDGAAHVLHRYGLLPRRQLHWVCDRFDLFLGVPPEVVKRRQP